MTTVEPDHRHRRARTASSTRSEVRYRVVGPVARAPRLHQQGPRHPALRRRLELPGMIHGRIVRSDAAQPPGSSASTPRPARALEGVVAVLTAADVPHNAIVEHASGGLASSRSSSPCWPSDRVRYVGEPVAIVAATDPEIAAEAADLVEVVYEALPGVFTSEDRPGRRRAAGARRGQRPGQLADPIAVTSTRRSPTPTSSSRTPTAASTSSTPTSRPRPGWDGSRTTSSRCASRPRSSSTRSRSRASSGCRRAKVRVIASYMGGGFGGKEDMTVEPYIALLVWRTRRPVRMVWSRQESIVASTKRHPFIMRYRTAATKDGKILAAAGRHPRRRRCLPVPVARGCSSPGRPARPGPTGCRTLRITLPRGVHQQRAVQRVPRVRRHAGRVRLRVPDGRAGGATRPVPDRGARPQLHRQGRPAAER